MINSGVVIRIKLNYALQMVNNDENEKRDEKAVHHVFERRIKRVL